LGVVILPISDILYFLLIRPAKLSAHLLEA